MFSLLSATVLILSKCFTPTFSETELPPQEPQPSVREGASLKLYRSPIPPWEEGVLIRIRQVFIVSLKSRDLLFFCYRVDIEGGGVAVAHRLRSRRLCLCKRILEIFCACTWPERGTAFRVQIPLPDIHAFNFADKNFGGFRGMDSSQIRDGVSGLSDDFRI